MTPNVGAAEKPSESDFRAGSARGCKGYVTLPMIFAGSSYYLVSCWRVLSIIMTNIGMSPN